MKNQAVIDELVGLGIYEVDYKNTSNPTDGKMVIVDNDNSYREVSDNGLTDEELKLLLSAKQTSYLKSIKTMVTFFTILTVISICFCLYLGFKINSIF